jgi:HK97 family phage prohead protease
MPISANREYRALTLLPTDDAQKIVEGNFSTYDEPYMLYSYDVDGVKVEVWEEVKRGAFDETDVSDVIMQYDHQGRVFARGSNGTLELELKEEPHMRAQLGGTEIGRQLYEEIKGGYTTKMSFGFTVKDDERSRVEENNDGIRKIKILRSIKSIKKLYDVSAVSLPANDQTSISARAYADGVSDEVFKEIEEEVAHEKEIRNSQAKALLELRLRISK